LISNVRGRGLFIAFDLPDGESRNRFRSLLWDKHFATLACGPASVRFRPALTFSRENVDEACDKLSDAMKEWKK
ncbi:MAG: aminotransferase class III-fold pyridoxal phosphate-dependent enzyme, partial [Planctomycetota bacterium]|nr:aminotransferase class III-fold pyridoxal phosphate-dependent enzyme [Planctomycetota bacterium]